MPQVNASDIQYKASSGTFNLDEAQGIVECFVAGIGNKDSVGDVCASGAFTKSLLRRKPRVVWGHNWNDPIGKVLDIYEVPTSDPRLPMKMKMAGIGGLYAKVQFNLQSEKGKEAFANVAFFGEEQEWSIGYKTLRAQYDQNMQANVLYEVELYEVSPVLHGANQLTGTISVKGEEIGYDTMERMPTDMPTQQALSVRPINTPTSMGDQGEDISQKLMLELEKRTGTKIKIISLSKDSVIFNRHTSDGNVAKYRCGFHYNGREFMFGQPERMVPQGPMAQPIQAPARIQPQSMGRVVKPVSTMPMPVAIRPGENGPVSIPLPAVVYEDGSSKKPRQPSVSQLDGEESELVEALVRITKKYGKFNEDSKGVYAAYTPAAENELINIGVKCSNCVFFKGEGSCGIIDEKVESNGRCRFAVIPPGFVNGGVVVKKQYNDYLNEIEVKWVEDIEEKYPGEFILGAFRNLVKKRRKRRTKYKELSEFDAEEYAVRSKSLEIGTEQFFVIPVSPEIVFDVKTLLDPVLNHHRVESFVDEYGIVLTSGITNEFVEAADIAVKSIGTRIGKLAGSRLIDRPTIGGKKKRNRDGLSSGVNVPTGGVRGNKKPTGTRIDVDGDGWTDEGTTSPVWVGLSSGVKPKTNDLTQGKKKIVSSSVESVTYDRSSKKLSVVFRSNKPGEKSKVYEYLNVSPKSWNEVQESDSLGKAINKIKQKHNVKFDGKVRKPKKSSKDSSEKVKVSSGKKKEEVPFPSKPLSEFEETMTRIKDRQAGIDKARYEKRMRGQSLAAIARRAGITREEARASEQRHMRRLRDADREQIESLSEDMNRPGESLSSGAKRDNKTKLRSGINDSERNAASDGFPVDWFEDVPSSRQKQFLEGFIQKNPSLDQGGKFRNDFLDGDEKATEMVSAFAENEIIKEISKPISGARGVELNQRMNEFEDRVKQNKKKEKKAINDWLRNIGKKNKLSSGREGRPDDAKLTRKIKDADKFKKYLDDINEEAYERKPKKGKPESEKLSSGKNNTNIKTSPLDGMKEGTRLSSGKLDEVYKSISAKLIKAIEEADGDKWEAPWYKNNAFPKNPTNNNRPYSNTNLLFLMFAQEEKGYTKPLWATYKQWEKAGGQVRKGEKGTGILVPRVFKDKENADGTKKAGGVFYTVATLFNVDQIDGIDVAELEKNIPKISEEQRITQLENAIKEIGANITEATQSRAFYRPSTDEIVMPRFEDFKSPLDFYATQAHELMHWTGHTSRLNRPNMNSFGTEAYAYEELVAEIASAFFMAAHGLSAEPQPQHAKYLASWLKRLKSDQNALQKAVQDAQKATNFAINLSPSMRKQIAISENVDDVPGVTIPSKTGDTSTGKLSSGKNWNNPDTQKRLIDFAKSKPKTKKNGEESFFASVVRQFESRGKLYDSQWAKLDEISPSGETPKPKSTTKLATKFSNKPRKITELEDIEEYDYPKLPENRKPTVEQGAAIDAMMTGEDTKIGALAATGKTTTVINFADRLLDKEPESRILYLVFNRNARDDAEARGMPENVNVMTMDALSFRAMRVAQPEMTKKSFKQMPGHILPLRSFIDRASYLGVKGTVSQGNDLSATDVYRRVSKAVDAYSISADEKIGPQHFTGAFNGKLKVEDEALIPELIEYANKMWQDMNMPRVSASGGKKGQGMLPISNSHITKMWALTKPDIGLSAEVNVAMVDEAQDMNPVFADLLRGGKNLQRIYIGDTNQAINAWRGADGKTLDEAYAKYDMPLTDSFRYGKEIAGMGNRFLSLLGRKERMTGLKKDKNGNPLDGKIGPIDNPTMILARSNGGAITATMEVFERGGTVFGSKNFKEDLSSFIDNLEFLETGSGGNRPYYTASTGTKIYEAPRDSADLDGITTFEDFEKAIERADNNRLNMLGKLTEKYSYSRLRDSLDRIITDKSKLPKNRDEYIHIQTAHTSKGLESPRVQIWTDFQKPKFDQESNSWILPDEQELRLSYVAVTRAEEELDLGSLQWITERTSDADGASKKLSSGGRLARRVNDNDKVTSKNRTTSSDVAKLSSGKKKSRRAKRKPFSAEDRQAVADGNRLRAQTIPGKRKQGPTVDEFGLSSGGGSRVYRRRESVERMSSGRGSEPKYLPITQGEKGTAAKIRERFKTPALVGSVSDNKTRKPDGPWMLEFSKFLPYLVFAGNDGKSRKEPTPQDIVELLNITDSDAKKLLKPGGAISEAAAADIFSIINPGTSDETMSKVDEWLDNARKIWGFDSAPYWYDYYDVRKNSDDKPKLLTREEFELMEESSFENNDVDANFEPLDMPDSDRSDNAKAPETIPPANNRQKIETPDEKRANFSYDKLLEFFGLEDASNEEIFEAFSVTGEAGEKIAPTVNQIRNWKQNGVPTAFILKLKEDEIIPSANDVFSSDASRELDEAIPQNKFYRALDNLLRENSIQLNNSEIGQIVGDVVNNGRPVTKLNTAFKNAQENTSGKFSFNLGKALVWSQKEIDAVIDGVNKKTGKKLSSSDLKFSSGKSGVGVRRINPKITKQKAEGKTRGERLSSGRMGSPFPRLTGMASRAKMSATGAYSDQLKENKKNRLRRDAPSLAKLSSGSSPKDLSSKDKSELIYWARNKGNWSNFAKSLLTQFEKTGELSPAQWFRLQQLHDNSVVKRGSMSGRPSRRQGIKLSSGVKAQIAENTEKIAELRKSIDEGYVAGRDGGGNPVYQNFPRQRLLDMYGEIELLEGRNRRLEVEGEAPTALDLTTTSGSVIDIEKLAPEKRNTIQDIRDVSTSEEDFARRLDRLVNSYAKSGQNITTKRSKNESSNGTKISPSKLAEDDRLALAEITDPVERAKFIDGLLEGAFYGRRIIAIPPKKK